MTNETDQQSLPHRAPRLDGRKGNLVVNISDIDSNNLGEFQVLDISSTGVAFEASSDISLSSGQQVILTMNLNQKPIRLKAEVKRPPSESNRMTAVEFTNVNDQMRAQIMSQLIPMFMEQKGIQSSSVVTKPIIIVAFLLVVLIAVGLFLYL